MFKTLVFKKQLSAQNRLQALFDFLGPFNKSDKEHFSLFVNWYIGHDFKWKTLSSEQAEQIFELLQNKTKMDIIIRLIFWPKTNNEWKDAFDIYLPYLHSKTQTIFNEEVLPFLKEAKPISCKQPIELILINLSDCSVVNFWKGYNYSETDKLKHVIVTDILRFINPSFVKQCAFCGKYFYSSKQNKIFCQRKCAIRAQQKKLEQKPEWRKKRRLYMREYMRDYRRKNKQN